MKIKFRGQKIAIRLMADDEIVNGKCIFRTRTYFGPDSNAPFSLMPANDWRESSAQGDSVGDHPQWEYAEIISSWFKL